MATFGLNIQLFNPALYSRVYHVWFSGLPAGATVASPELLKRWFAVGATAEDKAQFDSTCHSSFHAALDSISPEAYPLPPAPATWDGEKRQADAIAAPFLAELAPQGSPDAKKNNASTALSMILLLDQMPRNIFRTHQGVIYSHYDRLARAMLYSLLRQTPRVDLHPSVRYSLALRQWFYLPLMHSERVEDHTRYSELTAAFKEDLASHGEDEALKIINLNEDFEARHVRIIARFGRYPHRNKHLGRETTLEEKQFLESGGDSFGSDT